MNNDFINDATSLSLALSVFYKNGINMFLGFVKHSYIKITSNTIILGVPLGSGYPLYLFFKEKKGCRCYP